MKQRITNFLGVVRKNRVMIRVLTAWMLLIISAPAVVFNEDIFGGWMHIFLLVTVWIPLVWVVGHSVVKGQIFESMVEEQLERFRVEAQILAGVNEVLQEQQNKRSW